MMKVKDAKDRVRELLGNDTEVVCVREDTYEPATEVVTVNSNGIYCMVKFYEDGMVGYGVMNWDLIFE